MPQYTLTIGIDEAGVKAIKDSEQFVTIVKIVPTGTAVAWVSFSPLETNTITWDEQYSLYASTTNITDGALISTSSSKPALPDIMYRFKEGDFAQESTGLGPATYGVDNQDKTETINGVPEITSGLYSGAVVNGSSTKSPLNAVKVLYNEQATFTPIEKIKVFLSGFNDNGYVISHVTGQALEVDYTSTTDQVIHFDDSTNTFQPGQLALVARKA